MNELEPYIIQEENVVVPDAIYDSSGQMISPEANGKHLFIRGGPEDINIDAILSDALATGVILGECRNRRPAMAALAASIGGLAVSFETKDPFMATVSGFVFSFAARRLFKK